ncbi:uncharacterized protein LOC129734025 isoform X2 [Wyeomyia smithii]|uniref:uncharacterized protein LOC129734025 isoform X2 n=1 Tax=Wyeomyia smithii TaxID=174621 RepID=UPI002467E1F3|nr:uncharacterized protein LOC129734025 isoform X2 [Wyeomyia smithii]
MDAKAVTVLRGSFGAPWEEHCQQGLERAMGYERCDYYGFVPQGLIGSDGYSAIASVFGAGETFCCGGICTYCYYYTPGNEAIDQAASRIFTPALQLSNYRAFWSDEQMLQRSNIFDPFATAARCVACPSMMQICQGC